MKTSLCSFCLISGLALLGCSDDTVAPPGDTTPGLREAGPGTDLAGGDATPVAREAGGPDAAASVSFAQQVQPIFTASCAGAGCHAGTTPQAGMNLSGNAHAQIVNVQSTQCTTLMRVLPGDPAQSYLVQKIEGAGSCFQQQKMPVGGSLAAGDIQTIRTWIAAGAPNN